MGSCRRPPRCVGPSVGPGERAWCAGPSGELGCSLSRYRAKKLARQHPFGHAPRKYSPGSTRSGTPPRKNSPGAAKTLCFAPLSARWAKNFAFSVQALGAGRIFSRSWSDILVRRNQRGLCHKTVSVPGHDKPSPKPLIPLLAAIGVAMKPLTPLRGANQPSLKPRTPLQAETHLNSAIFHPQWCQWFHSSMITGQQRCPRFHLGRSAASKSSSVLCSTHLPH